MTEELGRAVAPGPFLPTVVASAILTHADDETRARWLRPLVDGTVTEVTEVQDTAGDPEIPEDGQVLLGREVDITRDARVIGVDSRAGTLALTMPRPLDCCGKG